jgi:hypothetical protein
MKSQMNRRDFLKTSAAVAAGSIVLPQIVPSSVFGADAPSKRVTMGFIGVGNQGTGDMRGFLQDSRVQVRRLRCQPREQGLLGNAVGGREPAKPSSMISIQKTKQIAKGELTDRELMREGHRRRRDGGSRPLARDPGHRRGQGRQGYLRPKALVADDLRRPRDGQRRQTLRPNLP